MEGLSHGSAIECSNSRHTKKDAEPGYTGALPERSLQYPARRPDVENTMKLKVVLFIAAVMTAVSVSAQDRRYDAPPPPQNSANADNTKYAWADVLRVDPVYDRTQTGGHEECEDVPVERHVDGGNNNA